MIAPTLTGFIQAIAKIRQLRVIDLRISSPTMLPREGLKVVVLIHGWRVWPLIRISGLVHIGVFTWRPLYSWFRQKCCCLVPCSVAEWAGAWHVCSLADDECELYGETCIVYRHVSEQLTLRRLGTSLVGSATGWVGHVQIAR